VERNSVVSSLIAILSTKSGYFQTGSIFPEIHICYCPKELEELCPGKIN
jgi:hypothetical protein